MPNRKIDENLFNAIKAMTAGGATVADIQRYTGLSHATISRVRAADTFEVFFATPSHKPKAQKPEPKPEVQTVEHRQTVTIQATHYMMQEMQKTNELLANISRKLAFIVDELTGVKTNAEQDH